MINRVLHTIPAEFKLAPNVEWRNPSIDDVMRNDPTEAVRSSILLDVLGFYFDVELKVDFGGGILHPMFDLLNGPRLADGSRVVVKSFRSPNPLWRLRDRRRARHEFAVLSRLHERGVLTAEQLRDTGAVTGERAPWTPRR